MNCPSCNTRSNIIDIRVAGNRTVVSRGFKYDGPKNRRRYKCPSCDQRWSTIEILCEILPPKNISNKKIKKKPKTKPKSKQKQKPKIIKEVTIKTTYKSPEWLKRIERKLNE